MLLASLLLPFNFLGEWARCKAAAASPTATAESATIAPPPPPAAPIQGSRACQGNEETPA